MDEQPLCEKIVGLMMLKHLAMGSYSPQTGAACCILLVEEDRTVHIMFLLY